MGAYVEDRLKGGFILDEGKIRKVVDLIENRLENEVVVYKVYRGDTHSYVTSTLADVINEDHEDWRAITKLQLIIKQEDHFEFELTFFKGASIYITGNDRDFVFLIYSDLKEYLDNEVMRKTPLSREHGMFISLFLSFFIAVSFSFLLINETSNKAPDLMQNALDSTNLNDKLNFLIEIKKKPLNGNVGYWLLSLFFIPLLTMTRFFSKVWKFFAPSNLFLFGDKQKKHELRMALISKFIWGVGVSLIVSILASVLVGK